MESKIICRFEVLNHFYLKLYECPYLAWFFIYPMRTSRDIGIVKHYIIKINHRRLCRLYGKNKKDATL